MFRFALLTVSLLAGLTTLSCQTYTTGLQQSVARADETSAMAALRTIAQAQQTYSVSSGGNYGTFQKLSDGGYLDSRFNSDRPQVKDYVLTMSVNSKSAGAAEDFYSCNADPVRAGEQAGRHLYIDSTSAVIHVNPSQPATVSDPALQP